MADFLDAEALASLVSSVTKTMCGATFVPVDRQSRGESLSARLVLLSLEGKRKINIVLAYDAWGSRALASTMFQCTPQSLDQTLIDDALRELLNMVAGQVSRLLKLDQSLGLPRPVTLADIAIDGGPGNDDGIVLRSDDCTYLRIWIFETIEPTPDPARTLSGFSRFRMLLRS